MNKSKSKRNQKQRRPLGKIVGGVYVVNAKRTTEPGTTARSRRPRRDARRKRWPGVDWGLRAVAETLIPADQWGPGDPRWRSRNLGVAVDRVLGWTSDVLSHTPLVGTPLGIVSNGIRGGVRWVEDGINSFTGRWGLVFFFLMLAIPTPVGAGRVKVSEKVSSGAEMSVWILSNCCNASDILYCSPSSCFHNPGCVICEDKNGSVVCWEPSGPYVSHPPGYTGIDRWFADHIDWATAGLLACDLLGVEEVCGVLIVAGEWVSTHFFVSVKLNLTADCYLEMSSGVDPSILGWLGYVKDQTALLTWATSLVLRIPVAFVHMVQACHLFTLGSVLYFLSQNSPFKAVTLLLLYVETATAHQLVSTEAYRNCSYFLIPHQCKAVYSNVSDSHCFSPFAARPTILKYGSETSAYPYSLPGTRFCIVRHLNGSHSCCRTMEVPPYCKYPTDAVWYDPRNTYEACGTTPWFSTAWRDGEVYPVALLGFPEAKKLIPRGENWLTTQVRWPGMDRLLLVFYSPNATVFPPRHWARLPGIPRGSGSSWLVVPGGFYSDQVDLATGLVTKDLTWHGYQFLYSATGSLSVIGLNVKTLVLTMLALSGSRVVFLSYLFFLSIQGVDAVPPALSAVIAASAGPSSWWWRLLALLVVWRAGSWAGLSINPCFATLFCFLLDCACGVEALDYESIPPGVLDQVFGASIPLAIALVVAQNLGAFLPALPYATLLHSYLSTRWEAWLYNLFRKPEILFFLTICFPGPAFWTCFGLLAIHFVVCFLFGCLASLCIPRTHLGLIRAIEAVGSLGNWVAPILQSALIWLGGERGLFLFKHLGQEPRLHPTTRQRLASVEPYALFTTQARMVEDRARKLACGDAHQGLPVVGRLNDLVMTGVVPLPRGWSYTAPFSLVECQSKGELRSFGVVMTGHDSTAWGGSIYRLGTMATTWMSFNSCGVMHTVFHGCRGRRIATPSGPMSPLAIDEATDYAIYPTPPGGEELAPCSCNPKALFVALRTGTVLPITHRDGELWNCAAPFRIAIAKGCSGAPALCAQGHVFGMFVSAFAARGAVSKVRIRKLRTDLAAMKTKAVDLSAPPPVPTELQITNMVAPTGSGKSTALPMHYVNAGYKTLVLNPSVATTASFPKFMHEKYGTNPNCYYGETSLTTGSKLTYSTYGRFLAMGRVDADVVICDECHATDATTILGIGRLLTMAPETKVKLIVLATATPPGCPLTPHSNISEVELDSLGEIAFHGKTLHLNRLKSGRHLIFQATKKHCEELANDLALRGINAVYYYRGLDVGKIPKTGDVVVVATDALCTGYTGNFDSVTDCGLMVEATVTVDMDPTITLGVQTVPTNNVILMQRRGRTGRGCPGIYYYVTRNSTLSGWVPDVSVVEAFDSGIAWFGLTPAEILAALDTYRVTPGLPAIRLNLLEWQGFYSALGWVGAAHVAAAKHYCDSFVMLTAAQRHVCQQNKWSPPNDKDRWKGMRKFKDSPAGILFHLDGPQGDNGGPEPELVEVLRACFADNEVYTANFFLAATGIGIGLVTTYLAVDTFGSVAIRQSWRLGPKTTAESLEPPPVDEGEVLEECTGYIAPEIVIKVADKLRAALNHPSLSPPAAVAELVAVESQSLKEWLGPFAPQILSAVQYAAGLFTLSENVLAACAMTFTAGFTSPLAPKITALFSLFGGVLASRLATNRGALAFMTAGALGAFAAQWTPSRLLGELLGGYAAATSVANVVFKALCLELPTMAELGGVFYAVLSPAAAGIGALAAVALFALTRSGPDFWPNRLLAMLTRGNVLPDHYFMEAQDTREIIKRLLHDMTPWSIICRITEWLNRPTESNCCLIGWASVVWQSLGRILRVIYEAGRGLVNRVITIPGFPIYSCQRAYRGPWAGEGLLYATCTCGRELVWKVETGVPKLVRGSRLCACYWTGVPVNSSLSGAPRPSPRTWTTCVVHSGFDNYIKYEKMEGSIYVTAVSGPTQHVPRFPPKIEGACMVDGVRIDPWSGDPKLDWKESALIYDVEGSSGGDKVGTRWWKAEKLPYKVCGLEAIQSEYVPTGEFDYEITGVPAEERDPEYFKARGRAGGTTANLTHFEATKVAKELGAQAPEGEGWHAADIPENAEGPAAEKFREKQKHEREIIERNKQDRIKLRELEIISKTTTPEQQREAVLAVETDSLFEFKLRKRTKVKTGSGVSDRAGCAPTMTLTAFQKGIKTDLERAKTTLTTDETALGGPAEQVKSGWDILSRPPPMRSSSVVEIARPKSSSSKLSASESDPEPEPEVASEDIGLSLVPSDQNPESVIWRQDDSSQWETVSEVTTSKSYIWNGAQISLGVRKKAQSAVRVLSTGMMRVRNLVYSTNPYAAEERKKKVTIHRTPTFTPAYMRWHAKACVDASKISCREWSLEEVSQHTPRKSAKSAVSGITGAQVRDGDPAAMRKVSELLSEVRRGKIPERFREVTVVPKEEVFVKTPQKPTEKPPRLIAYPHLEMRCVEKIVYGQLAPAVVKQVMGSAYGFQYTPAERVNHLVALWRSKSSPVGMACDTVCFDSTISPEDVHHETMVYTSARITEQQRSAAWLLAKDLYAGGPMVSYDGRALGVRQCRASGVYTTSSSNCLTTWLKVNAAAETAGMRKPSFLICGDDCVCIWESDGQASDKTAMSIFASQMKILGAPQDCVPTPRYSLEELESCSSNVTAGITPAGKSVHFLTRDPSIPLARCSAEGDGYNTTAAWIGFMIHHYPTLFASRILATQLLSILLVEPSLPETVTFDWYGKAFTVPLLDLPLIVEAVHGDAARIARYTPREISRTGAALAALTMQPMRYWKKRSRMVRASCVKRGGSIRWLAERLLWFASSRPPAPFHSSELRRYRSFNYTDFYADPTAWEPKRKWRPPTSWAIGICGLMLAVFAILVLR
nr:TPA_asm: polyprotein [Bat hepacivirus]